MTQYSRRARKQFSEGLAVLAMVSASLLGLPNLQCLAAESQSWLWRHKRSFEIQAHMGLNSADSKLQTTGIGISPVAGSSNGGNGLQVGARINLRPNSRFQLETGFDFHQIGWNLNLNGGLNYSLNLNAFHIPLMARWAPVPWFSIGAGPFLLMRIGPATGSAFQGSSPKTSASVPLATIRLSPLSFGPEISMRFAVPIEESVEWILEGAAAAGIGSNSTDPALSYSFFMIHFLTGVRLPIGLE